MKSQLIQIGNSKGIRLPKAILEQCHLEKNILIEVKNEALIIKSEKSKPRQGWEKSFQKMSMNQDDNLIINDDIDIEMDDWEW